MKNQVRGCQIVLDTPNTVTDQHHSHPLTVYFELTNAYRFKGIIFPFLAYDNEFFQLMFVVLKHLKIVSK